MKEEINASFIRFDESRDDENEEDSARKSVLRHWLKSSLHTAPEFMKVPLERNSAGLPAGRLFVAALYFRSSLMLFSLSSSSSFVPSKAWIHELAPQLWKHCLARQGSPGSREAPLQMLEIPVVDRSPPTASTVSMVPRYYFIGRVVLSHVRSIEYHDINVYSK